MQNFGRENFDDSTCIRQISSDFSTVKVLRYTVMHAGQKLNVALSFTTTTVPNVTYIVDDVNLSRS